VIEGIARAIAYGAVRGYLDALRDATEAEQEIIAPTDAVRASRFRDAVRRMRAGSGSAGHDDTAPASQAGDGDHMGKKTG